jgi:hypothetical protein
MKLVKKNTLVSTFKVKSVEVTWLVHVLVVKFVDVNCNLICTNDANCSVEKVR